MFSTKELLKARQSRKADRKVDAFSRFAAEYIENKQFDKDDPIIRLNPGATPKSLSNAEFIDRVGLRTIAALGRRGYEGFAQYDHDLSSWYTEESERQTPAGERAEARVVFITQAVNNQPETGTQTNQP